MAPSATKAWAPPGTNAIPYGCEARGNATVLLTASVPGSITLIEALRRFVTQIEPFGATAIARGALPTLISPSLA